MNVAINDLRSKIVETMRQNCNESEANLVADYMVWAEMSGIKTQGILKLAGTEPLQEIKRAYEPKVTRDTKLSQVIDAGASPAPIVSLAATQVAIEKSKEHGIGMVGVRNTFSSNGAQAYYVEKIAASGLVGLMCSRSPSVTTAFGSIDPLFGTNPIGFAFPTLDEPIVFDAATSAITFYGLVMAKTQGQAIPEGIAIDKQGDMTTDPGEAMNGAVLPFDRSYKGGGLAMLVELLAGPFIGSSFIDNQTFKKEWGTFIMAIDPELFVSVEDFKASTTKLREQIRSSRTSQNHTIRMPGDEARKHYKVAEANGYINIDTTIYDKIFGS